MLAEMISNSEKSSYLHLPAFLLCFSTLLLSHSECEKVSEYIWTWFDVVLVKQTAQLLFLPLIYHSHSLKWSSRGVVVRTVLTCAYLSCITSRAYRETIDIIKRL